MKKYIVVFLVLLNPLFFLHAENNTVNETFSSSQNQTDPWIKEVGLRYNMAILAKLYKDGVLFQPTGIQLGVFKDNKCWGFGGLGNSPVGPLFNVTIGYNSASATGFTYNVFDPNTYKYYLVTETVNFTNGVPVGAINEPITLNIKNEILTAFNPIITKEFCLSPNPIESHYQISFDIQSENNVSISIYNLQGLLVKTIFEGSVGGEKILSFQKDSQLTNGLYLIKVTIGDKHLTQKIVFK